MRISLRTKLMLFAAILAIIPLGIAGRTLINITRDELKSSVNEELSTGSVQLASDIDAMYEDIWRAPLLLIRKGVDNPRLGINEKASLLTNGTESIEDLISIQISAKGVKDPLVITNQKFTDKIKAAGLTPLEILPIHKDYFAMDVPPGGMIDELNYLPETNMWMMTIAFRLKEKIRGRSAVLAARINLERLHQAIMTNRLNQSGFITLVDTSGQSVLDPGAVDLADYEVVKAALSMLKSESRASVVKPYKRPSGEKMLASFGFPQNFNWAIIVEEDEKHAYQAVAMMTRSLTLWVIIGLSVALIAGIFGSRTLSKPILQIGNIAQKVGIGDLSVRVDSSVLKYRDEIGDLGRRMNEMIEGLLERFHLTKFVSDETVTAIKRGGDEGIKLGGERKEATVFFSDIRGFTAFSEKVEPEVVIEMLNTHLSVQAELVKKYHGDVDKYVGDELVAVFQGENMVANAVECAVDIQRVLTELNKKHPQWNIGIGIGINTGDMVMGAMGSEDRMDYTILGDSVNLGARLCSCAARKQIIMSRSSFIQVMDEPDLVAEKLEPVKVKGKTEPIPIYNVRGFRRKMVD